MRKYCVITHKRHILEWFHGRCVNKCDLQAMTRTDFYKSWYGRIPPRCNYISEISYQSANVFWFCEGLNFAVSHRKAWSPLTRCWCCTNVQLVIWTDFGTEHKYNTINTPEWPSSHNLKVPDGGGKSNICASSDI